MSVIVHQVDERTGELLMRAVPPPKPIALDWIRGVHFELGRLLEQLDTVRPTQPNAHIARCAFITASRMLVSDLYVAIRHAELELEPNPCDTDVSLNTPCARCNHSFAVHQAPGAECTVMTLPATSDDGQPRFCKCPRFQTTLPAPKGG